MRYPSLSSGSIFAILFIFLIISVLLSLLMGPAMFFNGVISDFTRNLILFDIRAPRILAAVLAGSGLATAGAVMQALFRNPLADPYILGTSSGGAVGAAIAIVFLGGLALIPAALIGSISASMLVYGISKRQGKISVPTLLLSGIAISMSFSAILSFLMFMAGNSLHQIFFWLMGGLWTISWIQVAILSPVLPGIIVAFLLSRELDIFTCGDDTAQSLGIDCDWYIPFFILLASGIVGICVSVAGSIGFIGLIIPHIARMIFGPAHRVVIPASALGGALLLLWADTAARSFLNEIPVGILTACLGAPFFVYLIRRRVEC